MLRVARSREGRLALGLLVDRFDPLQVMREVARAYRMGDLAPGMDSLVVYEAGLDVSGVSVADLFAIRDCVARHEAVATIRSGEVPTYRGVFVAAEREAQIIANVYTATWQGAGHALPQHTIATTLTEAEARLYAPPLVEQIAALRLPTGLRYLA